MVIPNEAYIFVKSFNEFILSPAFQFLRSWWWFLLFFPVKDFFLDRWLWWRNEMWLSKEYHPILLELIIPQSNKKPVRAMETVFANIHQTIYKPADPWEEWIDGQLQTSVALEIVSIEGNIHFYIRMDKGYRDALEAAFYAQYPSLEIVEVEDYTRKVPLNMPNKDWGLWGTAYNLIRPDGYPIKTYKDFETEKERDEEQKVDPVATLLEALAKVGPKEQLWIQMIINPVSAHSGSDWQAEASDLKDKIAKRPEKKKKSNKPILFEAFEILFQGPAAEEKPKEKDTIPPEMKMTPGERKIVEEIERKASKQGFETSIRFIFLGKKGFWNKGNLRLPFTYFSSYISDDLNALQPLGSTLTKIHYSWFLPLNALRDRRKYLKQRQLFRNYIGRLRPFFPHSPGKGAFVLNIEELASLFHFPSWEVSPVPGVSRVESKTKAPPRLPNNH
jgi:hypothetical protein